MATAISRESIVADRTRLVVSKQSEMIDAVDTLSMQTVVALRGELDAAALNSLFETFDDAIAQDDSNVVVDLAGVEFIGAAWIGTLVRSQASLEAQHRELTLRSPPRVVYRLLDLCGLSYLIEPMIERA